MQFSINFFYFRCVFLSMDSNNIEAVTLEEMHGRKLVVQK